jgi:DNA-directed RNA polymerase II subunit RPB2
MEVEKKIEHITEELKHVTTGDQLKKLISMFKDMYTYYKDTKRTDLNEKIKHLSTELKNKGKEVIEQTTTGEGSTKKEKHKELKDNDVSREGTPDDNNDKAEEEKDDKAEEEKDDTDEKEKKKKKQEKEEEHQPPTQRNGKNKQSLEHIFQKTSWRVLDTYFKDNPNFLVTHHLDSYNQFIQTGIPKIFRENNPLKYVPSNTQEANPPQLLFYLGGKSGKRITYGNPIIYDSQHTHYMYPNEARLRNMTYGMTIHYDVECEIQEYDPKTETYLTVEDSTIEKVSLGRFPIMLNSDRCILQGLSREMKYNLGECRQDHGGYFIIEGKEKVFVPEETIADNMIRVTTPDRVEVRSASEDSSKPIYITSVQRVAPSPSAVGRKPYWQALGSEDRDTEEEVEADDDESCYTNGQLVVTLPRVSQPIPLFIVMRALGVTSDRDIIQTCLLDLEKYSHYIDLFRPSIHDASQVFDQTTALKFIASFVKGKQVKGVLGILTDSFLPHIGGTEFLEKAYYLGYMVKKLFMSVMNEATPADLENSLHKRIALCGQVFFDVFQHAYQQQLFEIWTNVEKEYHDRPPKEDIPKSMSHLLAHAEDFFQTGWVEKAFEKLFKRIPHGHGHPRLVDLRRLSWFTTMSQLRQINLTHTIPHATTQQCGPHGAHWGYFDPLDTPATFTHERHLSITATITTGSPAIPLIKWIKKYLNLLELSKTTPQLLATTTKVFVNGCWIGNVEDPLYATSFLKLHRRNGTVPIFTSVAFGIQHKEIHIYTDAGRLVRPLYYLYYRQKDDSDISEDSQLRYYLFGRKDHTDTLALSLHRFKHGEPVKGEELLTVMSNWDGMVSGFAERKIHLYNFRENIVYKPEALFTNSEWTSLAEDQSVLEYIDLSEENTALIAIQYGQIVQEKKSTHYTHLEIDPSTILGMVGNSIVFPETNPTLCNQRASALTQQAVSIYHTNFPNRIDPLGLVLHYGQVPLVKSQYLEHINQEQIPYGVNCVVAVMCYTGYNDGEGILISEAALKRGLFRTSHYTMYEDREESYHDPATGQHITTVFSNLQEVDSVRGVQVGCDYSKLDESGLIPEGERLLEDTIVIGKVKIAVSSLETSSPASSFSTTIDDSTKAIHGKLGYVDKSFLTKAEPGYRVAKVRVLEDRLPFAGDTLASRAGHRGTIGAVVPEEDMPFTSQGVRPDLIINPHVIATELPVGQLVEALLGKACSLYGTFGDSTAFAAKGPNNTTYGSLLQAWKKGRQKKGDPIDLHDYYTDLQNIGYTSTGTEMLYNGMTGEQIESDIYVGVNYYMRIKDTVQDTLQCCAKGPLDVLTRQSLGGQLLGEPERDAILSHGMSMFLKTSFLDRADKFKLAICNKTGLISIYNLEQNLLLSPYVDGPMDVRFQMDVNTIDCRLDTTTRFGRSFSVVEIPYAFKLFLQELQVMGIEARVLTDKNIDRVMSLSGSDNIIKLTKDLRAVRSQAALHKHLQSYSKDAVKGLKNKKKHAKKQKKTKSTISVVKEKRTVIAQPEENEKEGEDEEVSSDEGNAQKEKEGGATEKSPVIFTLDGQPIDLPPPPPEPTISLVVQGGAEKLEPSITPSPTSPHSVAKSEAMTAVLRVEEPKGKEEENEEGTLGESSSSSSSSSSSGTTKSITLD